MPTPRSFEETVSGFENSHRLVIHLVEDCAGEHVHRYGSAVVGVWRRAGTRREGDFETDDAFFRRIGELVFVDQLECREWGACERVLASGWGCLSGRSSLLDVIDWLFHFGDFGINHCEYRCFG